MQDKPNTRGEDALHRFIDGMLDENDKLDMLDFLTEHEDEAARVESYHHQNNMLRALRRGLDVGDSDHFCPELQAKIVRELNRPPIWRHPIVASLAASVALVAVVGTLYLGFDQRPITKSDAGMKSEIGDESVEVAEASEVDDPAMMPVVEQTLPADNVYFPFSVGRLASSPDTIIPERPIEWFNDRMAGHSIRQPDLSVHGLDLVGVNVLSEKPTPALHLSYRDETGELVELFAGINSSEMSVAFRLVAEGHISLHWRLGDLLFALVAPSGSPQLTNIVATVSAAVEKSTETKVAVDIENSALLEALPSPVVPNVPNDLKINDLEIAAPLTNGEATMMFVPMPRPSERHDPIPVEPPQALPPSPDDPKAETL